MNFDIKEVASHYDELDPFYRALWGDHLHHGLWMSGRETPQEAVLELIKLVSKKAQLRRGMRVCDIGCGYGATARYLVEQSEVDVTAITLSEVQYKYAISLNPGSSNPHYLLEDWLKNSLDSSSFDAAIAIESSEHMPDKIQFLREAYRVLRSGGRLIICAWLSKQRPHRWESNFLLKPICREGILPSMGTVADYQHWMEEAGFTKIHFQDLTQLVRKTWRICALRCVKALFTNSDLRSFFFQSTSLHRKFAKTIFRIWLAYYTGSMHYGLFTAHK